ncbi:hypothetical protein [Pararhodobacter sp. CCB-MM2]|uniref:hypothetical protein n=1 Tax=Pararhodobacter sp. CCB-MM2 TaxID=1786003 RepID=UPI0011129B1E|nr:hypothetical protein [Pararhodobacter sp. CCB-MM2]
MIYLNDSRASYFLGPLRGVGETVAEMASALSEVLARLGQDGAYCLGYSGGGFGALIFSSRLGVQRSLVYSPPTIIRESLPIVIRNGANLEGLLSPEGAVDLSHLLQGSRIPMIRIYFSGGNEHDALEIENISQISDLDIRPFPDMVQHNLIPSMIARGLFGTHLEWLVRG